MLALRINLMEVILQSPNSYTIEKLIGESLNHRFENMPNEFSRFIKLFESDLLFQLQQKPISNKLSNIIEAHRVIKNISIETIKKNSVNSIGIQKNRRQ